MLLDPALEPKNPITSMLLVGSENMAQSYDHSTPYLLSKLQNFHESLHRMNATLTNPCAKPAEFCTPMNCRVSPEFSFLAAKSSCLSTATRLVAIVTHHPTVHQGQ